MKLIDILNDKKINVYHGTSFLKNAEGIINNGLQPIGNFITVGGGDESPSMGGRSYVGKELWNAIRYSFMMNRSYSTWEEFIKKEPYGYVFEFLIDVNTLLPDEDDEGKANVKTSNLVLIMPGPDLKGDQQDEEGSDQLKIGE